MLPSNKDIECQLPCSTLEWESPEQEWLQLDHTSPLDFNECLTSILDGCPVIHPSLSSLAVVILLCAILVQIATHERVVWHKPPLFSEEWILDILAALHAWEDTWKAHPERTPNPFDKNPVMADAIPLLNTAYFHIFAPRLLSRIKGVIREASLSVARGVTEVMTLGEAMEAVKPNSGTEREYMLKAAAHATHSLFVRAKFGYSRLGKISSLDSGFHYGFTGFESCTNPRLPLFWEAELICSFDFVDMDSMDVVLPTRSHGWGKGFNENC
jgi:hypothetical protein